MKWKWGKISSKRRKPEEEEERESTKWDVGNESKFFGDHN